MSAAPHRIPLADGWALWKWIWVRAAGFPAREVLKLVGPDEDRERISQTLRDIASGERFREAVTWQNRRALCGSIASLLRKPVTASDWKTRQREHLVASYLQRYCAKNDTIGFFGPVAWGTIDPASGRTRVEPGPALLARRTVYFEYWAIDALAEKLAESPDLKPWLRPRRKPTLWIEGRTLHYPINRQTALDAEHAWLLQACDGETSARDIAAAAVAIEDIELDHEEEVFELLDELKASGLILWTIEIPTATARPEDHLRSALGEMGEAGTPGLRALAALEERREAVARAAGDADALGNALADLDDTFEGLTQKSAVRNAGRMYAGRTPVYEDCRRDLSFVLGHDLLERLGPPLALVLQSARWYTFRIAARYRQLLDRAYDELCAQTGATAIDYLRFWEQVRAHFPGGAEPSPIVRDVAGELSRRWAEILAIDAGAKAVCREVSALVPRVAEAFSAPHPGWPTARYHSPDVLIAAHGIEALVRGDCFFVLGELHAATNTSAILVAQNEHDDPDALLRARAIDLPDPAVVPVMGKQGAKRAAYILLSENNVDLEIGDARSPNPRSQVLTAGALAVERDRGRLVVFERNGTRRFDIIAFLADLLTQQAASGFSILPEAATAPRVTVGDLVIARQTWRFGPEELGFARIPRGPEQLARIREWARSQALPRQVFVKVPEEPKPVYVDFESPVYMEMLARTARKASQLTVTEMLPRIEDTWLPDAAGRTYTCELRVVAVDPERWTA